MNMPGFITQEKLRGILARTAAQQASGPKSGRGTSSSGTGSGSKKDLFKTRAGLHELACEVVAETSPGLRAIASNARLSGSSYSGEVSSPHCQVHIHSSPTPFSSEIYAYLCAVCPRAAVELPTIPSDKFYAMARSHQRPPPPPATQQEEASASEEPPSPRAYRAPRSPPAVVTREQLQTIKANSVSISRAMSRHLNSRAAAKHTSMMFASLTVDNITPYTAR